MRQYFHARQRPMFQACLCVLLLLGINTVHAQADTYVLQQLKTQWYSKGCSGSCDSALQTWKSQDYVCSGSYYGVTCTNGSVSAIRLNHLNLQPNIPPIISRIRSLTAIDFSSNPALTSSIPMEISTLTNLAYLNLQNTGLSSTLPSQISLLTALTYLDLGQTSLNGSLPSTMSTMTALGYLSIGSSQMTGPIPPQLSSLVSLTSFSLANCTGLNGSLPQGISAWTNLISLSAYNMQLTGSIPPQLSSMASLTALILHSSNLNGPLPPTLSFNQGNGTLSAYNNHGLCGPIDGFPDLSKQGTNLGLPCGGAHVQTDFDVLQQLKTQWYSKGCSGTCDSALQTWTSLNDVCSGSYYGVTCINGRVASMRLNSINLQPSLPPMISSLEGLTAIDFSSNSNLGSAIPPQLSTLTNLVYCNLEHTGLNATLPAQLSTLTALSFLSVASSQLTGLIPTQFSNMTSLRNLLLHANKLNGALPPSLSFVTTFSVHDNHALCGPIKGFSSLNIWNTNLKSPCGSPLTWDTLYTDTIFRANDQLYSSNKLYRLQMQEDGNLVIVDNLLDYPVWSTGTSGNSGATVSLQQDGNLVLRKADSTPIWNTNTVGSGATRLTFLDNGNIGMYKTSGEQVLNIYRDTLAIGEVLGPGDKLYSSNVCYVLHMEPGGNLRAYHNCAPHRDKEIWSSGTDGFAGAYTIFRPNGYLEVMVPWSKDSIWNQDVLNNDALRLTMQTDGKVTAYTRSNVPYLQMVGNL